VLHPERYARVVARGGSPAAGRERLTPAQRRTERTMLELRLATGLALEPGQAALAESLCEAGLIDPDALRHRRARLTLAGRLLADEITRRLLAPGHTLNGRCESRARSAASSSPAPLPAG
jgi:coproporphyrinogen III oxidase-like Fe-S oxidoreductase